MCIYIDTALAHAITVQAKAKPGEKKKIKQTEAKPIFLFLICFIFALFVFPALIPLFSTDTVSLNQSHSHCP